MAMARATHGPATVPSRSPTEAALADAVLAHADPPSHHGPIHLVGHSYGGAVALRFAMQQPERLRSLVLIEPVAFHLLRDESPDPANRRLFGEVMEIGGPGVAGPRPSGDYRRAMARFVDYWNGEGAWLRAKPDAAGRARPADAEGRSRFLGDDDGSHAPRGL